MDIPTIKDLNNYNLLHGHKKISNFVIDEKLTNTITNISHVEINNIKDSYIKYISKFKMKKLTKKFLDNYISLHNVGFLSNKKLQNMVNKLNVSSIYELAYVYNESAVSLDPYKIPINYVHKNVLDGTLNVQTLVTEDEKYFKELFPLLNIYFTDIDLSYYVTEITPACYVHEIIHSQLESHKGIIKNYINTEVLSIFFELLYTFEYNKNIYNVILLNRINYIISCYNNMYRYKNNMSKKYNEYNYYSDAKYIVSTLIAFNLFDKYINYNDKKELLINIQNVLNGSLYLEEYLKKYNATYDESLSDTYIKRIFK